MEFLRKVVLLRGVSGAGKSTFTANHYPTAVVASADHYFGHGDDYKFDHKQLGRAHDYCFQTFNAALNRGEEVVVVDNTNTTLRELKPYVACAESKGYAVEVVRLKVDPKVASERNVHGVPHETVMKMQNRFQDFPGEIVYVDGVRQ